MWCNFSRDHEASFLVARCDGVSKAKPRQVNITLPFIYSPSSTRSPSPLSLSFQRLHYTFIVRTRTTHARISLPLVSTSINYIPLVCVHVLVPLHMRLHTNLDALYNVQYPYEETARARVVLL